MSDEASSPTEPQAFVRRIDIPPGAPWDQRRAAKLDALHGAPLGPEFVATALARLDRWRPGMPGRFATAYVRRSDLPADRIVEATVEGRTVRFTFGGFGFNLLRQRRLLQTGVPIAVATVAVALALQGAQARRQANEQLLARLETHAAQRERIARREAQLGKDAALIGSVAAERSSVEGLAADLAWLGQARRPTAIVRKVNWSPDGMVVVSTGPDRPVLGSERSVEGEPAASGVSEWQIGAPPAPVIKQGVARPSVVSMAAPAPGVELP